MEAYLILVGVLGACILFMFSAQRESSASIEDLRTSALAAAEASDREARAKVEQEKALGISDAKSDLRNWLVAIDRAARFGHTSLWLSDELEFDVRKDNGRKVKGRDWEHFFSYKTSFEYKRSYIDMLSEQLGSPFRVVWQHIDRSGAISHSVLSVSWSHTI